MITENMLQYLILGTISFVFIIYYFMKCKFNYWKVRNILGPKPLPIFGNIKDTVLRKENTADTFEKIYNQFPNEPVVGFFRMTSPCLLLRDLEIIKHVMIKDFDIFEDRGIEFSKEGLGANLFHADGETWRVLRHKFTPIFTTGKLKNMTYLVVEQCDKFMTFLENSVATQSEQEIYYHLKRYTISTITACAFGLSVNTLSEPLMKTLAEIDKLTLQANIFHEIDMMVPGLLKSLNLSLFPLRVQNFFEEMVSKVIKERNGKPSHRNDFMDVVLELREQGEILPRHETKTSEISAPFQLTNSVIAAQAFAFYVAGYETSATTLSYLLFELARNPKVQDKAIAEVDSILKKHDGQITYESLNELSYIDCIFNEVYRKYPIVPLLRRSNSDYKVPETNIVIEKGTVIVLSAAGIHRDEKYYPNPELFDPDRFNSENSKDRHPCAFLPFGVGPRNCIGQRFAKLQTRIGLLKLLSKFRVKPSSLTTKIKYDPDRVLGSPADGVYLKLIPRT